MRRFGWIAAIAAVIILSSEARAQSQGVVVKQSAFSVTETMDRLEKVFERKGFKIFGRIGVDMPLKALVYRDKSGKVFLVYDHPAYIARRHGIKKRSKLVKAVARILTNLTDQAVKTQ